MNLFCARTRQFKKVGTAKECLYTPGMSRKPRVIQKLYRHLMNPFMGQYPYFGTAIEKGIHVFPFCLLVLQERLCQWKLARERLLRRTGSQEEILDASDLGSVDGIELQQPEMDIESRRFLSRKVPIPASKIYPYRVSMIFRLVILGFFLRYRLTHPVHNA